MYKHTGGTVVRYKKRTLTHNERDSGKINASRFYFHSTWFHEKYTCVGITGVLMGLHWGYNGVLMGLYGVIMGLYGGYTGVAILVRYLCLKEMSAWAIVVEFNATTGSSGRFMNEGVCEVLPPVR